jgi:hypothetical protein
VESGTGSFRAAGAEANRELTVRGFAEPVLRPDRMLWFVMRTPLQRDHVWLSMQLKDGKLVDEGVMAWGKGYQCGSVKTCDLQWDGHRVSGSLEVLGGNKGKLTGAIKMDGVVIGDQVFAACTAIPTKGERQTGVLRGGLLEADAPPFCGWEERAARKFLDENPDRPLPDLLKPLM